MSRWLDGKLVGIAHGLHAREDDGAGDLIPGLAGADAPRHDCRRPRARELYESQGFVASGRRKDDGLGNEIVHYVRKLEID